MPTTPPTRVQVLFICIGNACRSPMAESIALREAADVIEPSSAGLYPLGCIAAPTVDTLLANGYSVEGLSSKCLSRDAVRRSNVIVNLSGGPIEHLFSRGSSKLREGQKVEDWKVLDPYGEDSATYQRILEQIETRVRELANRLRAKSRPHRDK